MRLGLLLLFTIAACTASQHPTPNPPPPAPSPTPTPTPTPTPAPPVVHATDSQCNQAIDHVVSLLLAAPEIPDSDKQEWSEKAPALHDQMLAQCRAELTPAQFDCIMSKQSFSDLHACDK